jgi:hypothetical protein
MNFISPSGNGWLAAGPDAGDDECQDVGGDAVGDPHPVRPPEARTAAPVIRATRIDMAEASREDAHLEAI